MLWCVQGPRCIKASECGRADLVSLCISRSLRYKCAIPTRSVICHVLLDEQRDPCLNYFCVCVVSVILDADIEAIAGLEHEGFSYVTHHQLCRSLSDSQHILLSLLSVSEVEANEARVPPCFVLAAECF